MTDFAQKEMPQDFFEEDYKEITKNFEKGLGQETFQWTTPQDFFKKFSLYPERSSSTTSANTSMNSL